MKRKLFPSLEEDPENGTFNKEIEHVYYGRITDFKQLEKANSKERQEQWEVKIPLVGGNAAKGSIRVRSTKIADCPIEYTLTSKITLDESGEKMEVSLPTTAEQFIQFKFLAKQGMVKDRYTFDTENGLKWEVDVFLDPKGGYFQWCKIDLEVPSMDTPIPAFPLELTNQIDGTSLERDSSEDKKVQSLYDQYFLTKNVYKHTGNVELQKDLNKEFGNKVQNEVVLD